MAHTDSGKDPLLLNKVSGAVLGAMLFVMGLNIGAEAIFHPSKPAIPGYDLPSAPEGGAQSASAPAQAAPIAERLASANAARGESVARQCLSCHSLKADGSGANTGPHLFGVVGRQKAGEGGYGKYSQAMQAHKGEQWTPEDLDKFIANPKGAIPGTTMAAFQGVSNPDRRADLIAYLQGLK